VSAGGQPDVAPVGYEFDGAVFYVGGFNPTATRKWRNIQAGNASVALVVDDLVAIDPWTPRFLRVYGTAELIERSGWQFGSPHYLRITPAVSWSWNLDGRPLTSASQFQPRRTVHGPARVTGGELRDRMVSLLRASAVELDASGLAARVRAYYEQRGR
jgi:pyridoxamine 5'-phosphate oxidase family protein